ncbi:MAG: DUF4406 domain-containing protein [Lachnospiraceae bacterium]|nr:DUF4406 domain-containing protein [Lachnospiraceae bacterium]
MKIYISGPISGLDPEKVRETFGWARGIIDRAGHIAVNPTDLPQGFTWETYMQIAGAIIGSGEIDAVYMMSGWKRSRGAVIEWTMARAMRIPAIYQDAADRRLWGEER